MRNSSPVQLANAVVLSANRNSNGIYLNQTFVYSIQAIWTGASALGSVKIQISNDNVQVKQYSNLLSTLPDPAANVVNWTDYSGTSQAISGPGSFMWNFSDCGYAWVRAAFTFTSGTGLWTVNAWVKGS